MTNRVGTSGLAKRGKAPRLQFGVVESEKEFSQGHARKFRERPSFQDHKFSPLESIVNTRGTIILRMVKVNSRIDVVQADVSFTASAV
jgi:hypothetical protein